MQNAKMVQVHHHVAEPPSFLGGFFIIVKRLAVLSDRFWWYKGLKGLGVDTINKEIAICEQLLRAWDCTTLEQEREVIYRLNMLRKIKREVELGAVDTSPNR